MQSSSFQSAFFMLGCLCWCATEATALYECRVTSTADTPGQTGTLRACITDVNNQAAAGDGTKPKIVFDFPDETAVTINVLSELPAIETAVIIDGGAAIAPGSITVAGACDDGVRLNGNYVIGGATADGKPFYKHSNASTYLHHDRNCGGGYFTKVGNPARWILTDNRPSTTAAVDLDGDGTCDYNARINSASYPTVPTGTKSWRMKCNNSWTDAELSIAVNNERHHEGAIVRSVGIIIDGRHIDLASGGPCNGKPCGLQILASADDVEVRGIAIVGFPNDGLVIAGKRARIQGEFSGNGDKGIVLQSKGTDAIIGAVDTNKNGSADVSSNTLPTIVSSNTKNGIYSEAPRLAVLGNVIVVSNGETGIWLWDTSTDARIGNSLGNTASGAVVIGMNEHGISCSAPRMNIVGNVFIGVDATGNTISNPLHGINIAYTGADASIGMGMPTPTEIDGQNSSGELNPVVIGKNKNDGIRCQGPRLRFAGNVFVGVGINGQNIGNGRSGVYITTTAKASSIGSTGTGMFASAWNIRDGIELEAPGFTLAGKVSLGVTSNGSAAGNGRYGLFIFTAAADATIGAAGNDTSIVIGANQVGISCKAPRMHVVGNVFIGAGIDGTDIGNRYNGIYTAKVCTDATIGTIGNSNTAGTTNAPTVIGWNSWHGISSKGANLAVGSNVFIGVTPAGKAAGNRRNGIYLQDDCLNARIGSSTPSTPSSSTAPRTYISGNGWNGISGNAPNLVVRPTTVIGLAPAASAAVNASNPTALGNGRNGIELDSTAIDARIGAAPFDECLPSGYMICTTGSCCERATAGLKDGTIQVLGISADGKNTDDECAIAAKLLQLRDTDVSTDFIGDEKPHGCQLIGPDLQFNIRGGGHYAPYRSSKVTAVCGTDWQEDANCNSGRPLPSPVNFPIVKCIPPGNVGSSGQAVVRISSNGGAGISSAAMRLAVANTVVGLGPSGEYAANGAYGNNQDVDSAGAGIVLKETAVDARIGVEIDYTSVSPSSVYVSGNIGSGIKSAAATLRIVDTAIGIDASPVGTASAAPNRGVAGIELLETATSCRVGSDSTNANVRTYVAGNIGHGIYADVAFKLSSTEVGFGHGNTPLGNGGYGVFVEGLNAKPDMSAGVVVGASGNCGVRIGADCMQPTTRMAATSMDKYRLFENTTCSKKLSSQVKSFEAAKYYCLAQKVCVGIASENCNGAKTSQSDGNNDDGDVNVGTTAPFSLCETVEASAAGSCTWQHNLGGSDSTVYDLLVNAPTFGTTTNILTTSFNGQGTDACSRCKCSRTGLANDTITIDCRANNAATTESGSSQRNFGSDFFASMPANVSSLLMPSAGMTWINWDMLHAVGHSTLEVLDLSSNPSLANPFPPAGSMLSFPKLTTLNLHGTYLGSLAASSLQDLCAPDPAAAAAGSGEMALQSLDLSATLKTALPHPVVTVSGACKTSKHVDGDYVLQDATSNGFGYYTKYGTNGSSTMHLYYDHACGGDDASAAAQPQWIFDADKPSIHAAYDLNGDGRCSVAASLDAMAIQQTSAWKMNCGKVREPQCKCNGKTQSDGNRGGLHCESKDSGGPFCYVDVGACSDGQTSTTVENAHYSHIACDDALNVLMEDVSLTIFNSDALAKKALNLDPKVGHVNMTGFTKLVAFPWHNKVTCPPGYFSTTDAPSKDLDVLCGKCPSGTEKLTLGGSLSDCKPCSDKGLFDFDNDASTPCEASRFRIETFEHYIPDGEDDARYAFSKTANAPLNNDPLRTPISEANITNHPRYFGVRNVMSQGGASYQTAYANVPILLPPIKPLRYRDAANNKIEFTIAGAPGNFFINPSTGAVFANPSLNASQTSSSFTATMYAVDGGGSRAEVETIQFTIIRQDTVTPANGPGSKICAQGKSVDGTPFDGAFTCDCAGTAFRGENCENRVLDCRPNEIEVNGDCKSCELGSTPNNLKTECIVSECGRLQELHVCDCQLTNLTDADSASINLTCNASRWLQQDSGNVKLPSLISRLTMSSVQEMQLPRLLQDLSFRHVEQVHLEGNVGTVDRGTNNALKPVRGTSNIKSVVLEAQAFIQAEPPVEQSATSHQNNTAGETSRSLAPLPGCGMNGLVPGLAFDVPIAICNNNGSAGACTSGIVCKVGEYAEMHIASSGPLGTCTKCERGGFYADTVGRAGQGSHCACSLCKNGTWSKEEGATDPINQCQVCPPGTQTDATAGYRACKCLDGFSRTDRFGSCTSCEGELGIECSGDARVLKAGYFWKFPTSEIEQEYLQFTANLQRSFHYDRNLSKFNGVYPPAKACPTKTNCLGVTETAVVSCLEGTTGPLCAVCEDTHYRMNGGCSKCPANKAAAAAVLVIVGLLLIAAIWLVLRCNAKDVPLVDEWYRGGTASKAASLPSKGSPTEKSSTSTEDELSFMTLVKIVLSYMQVKSLLVEVYPGVQWPTSYKSYTDAQQFASSNPVSVVMPSCVSASLTITSYGEFKFAALIPVAVLPIIWFYYLITSSWTRNVDQLRAKCISTASFVYFLLYPTIAVACVRVLAKCDDICDGTNCNHYLRADYSIDCGTDRHSKYRAGAAIAFAFYSVAMPAVIAYLMYRGRKGATPTTSSALMAGLSFYSKNYKPEYYYWETVDLYRKLLITSMVVFIADGTSMQITFGTIFAFIGFSLQLVYSPFVNKNENRLAVGSHVITVLSLIMGGLIRAKEAEEAAQMEYGRISEIVTGAYLITSGVLLYCLALIIWIGYTFVKQQNGLSESEVDVSANIEDAAQGELTDFARADESIMVETKRTAVEETMFSGAEESQRSGQHLTLEADDSDDELEL